MVLSSEASGWYCWMSRSTQPLSSRTEDMAATLTTSASILAKSAPSMRCARRITATWSSLIRPPASPAAVTGNSSRNARAVFTIAPAWAMPVVLVSQSAVDRKPRARAACAAS